MFPLPELVFPRSSPLHLYDSFSRAAERFPASMMHFDSPLATFEGLGHHATYAEVTAAVEHRGAQLVESGIAPGEQVVVYKSAQFDSYLLAIAISYAGAVPVMLSPHLDASTVDVMVARLGDPWLIHDVETEDRALSLANVVADRKLGAVQLGDLEPRAHHPAAPRRSNHEIVYMTHTSGTTGVPKLIAHSPTSMGWRVTLQRRILSVVEKRGLAAFHVTPVHSRFNIGISSLMSYGFSFLNIADARENNVEGMLSQYRPMILETHPNDFVRWASIVDRSPDAFSSVKYLHSTFDAINKGTMLKYLDASAHRLPVFLQVYGQSECGPMVLRAHTRFSLRWTDARWMGIAMPGLTSVRVVDENGGRLLPGRTGTIEMFSRGRAVTYYGEQERYDNNVHGRWWDSGDTGKVGPFGELALLDRQVDLVDNVESTLAIEDTLLDTLPFLDEVVLVHGEDGGAQPVVSVAEGREMDWSAWWDSVAELPNLRTPMIMTYNEIPRTATMKVQRSQLEHKLVEASR